MTFKQVGWAIAVLNLVLGMLNVFVFDNAPTGAANLLMFVVVTWSLST